MQDDALNGLEFNRTAAYDGTHETGDIATNTTNYGMADMIGKFLKRRVRLAVAIAKRDPKRTAEFISDAFMLASLLALVIVAWWSCKGDC